MTSNTILNNAAPVDQQQQQQQSGSSQRDVGILSIAAYFPRTYVSQADLEVYDNVSSGRYTKGLMQDKMAFCTDLEDIHSISLTVTKKLIDQTGISLKDVGYLEVGTETLVDKSKSVKTVLMELFKESGNSDVEGVDTTNACYGGTAALFHAIDHCQSPYWDGRLAIVVAADIAVYAPGNARATGGCGAIAMLIGPNAPLVFNPIRATHMQNVYDFYKPDPHSEYPTVDSPLSLKAYISALDKCYATFRQKSFANQSAKAASLETNKSLLDKYDGILFHSPYCKLVRKSFARLLFNEYQQAIKTTDEQRYKAFESLPREAISSNYDDWTKALDEAKNNLEKVATSASEQLYQEKTADSLYLANQVGNMYTASLYSCLVAYLISKQVDQLAGKELLFFSYGSGCASSMFSARLTTDTLALRKLLLPIQYVKARLEDRMKVTPEEFSAHLEHREHTFSLKERHPTGEPVKSSLKHIESFKIENYLYPETYYLTYVDGMFRRSYQQYESIVVENNNNNYESSCVMSKKPIMAQVVPEVDQKQAARAL